MWGAKENGDFREIVAEAKTKTQRYFCSCLDYSKGAEEDMSIALVLFVKWINNSPTVTLKLPWGKTYT
eukprot:11709681-Ditylum_brightwellii.AAC.1